MPVSAYPGGRAFLKAYRETYGVTDPDPYSIFGYEAMKLCLDTIAGLGPRGDHRSAILHALFSVHGRHSAIGTYGFTRTGDTTLRSYALYGVDAHGMLRFERNAL
jgi:branched-chain amino acid transport system substrate-binding protein